ncbi:LysR family transcriptional regulator [Marinobacterium rhizophilum]|uniref:LysR family transcriptional regulator n=1 Tax=Marinobacterium rhizophilum TaxID=420402 RepID=A0ABY5HID4_9GAMM|nr:LysR family transcriptional regulator [Marinobacterium rhizophilum]UTW12023.1 LysR family transcriptional regulator [Marinobacterium rhizophilum]
MSGIHDRLDWNLLRTFIAIVQEGSISRAAERLHLTQPAVSLALKRLEDRLGERMIVRSGNTFELSGAGELVYREAVVIYGSIARLSMAVRDVPNDLSGVVRLALVTGVNSELFDQVLSDFHRNNPRVTFEILTGSSDDVQHALLHYNAAFGICLKRRKIEGLSDTVLLHQRYYLYCGESHPLFGKKNLQVEHLRNENFVSFASEQLDGVLAPLALYRAQERLEGRTVGTSCSLDEVARMVRTGIGIGALPEHVVRADLDASRLWKLPPEDGVARISLYLMWNQNPRFSEAEEVFFSCLLGALRAAE